MSIDLKIVKESLIEIIEWEGLDYDGLTGIDKIEQGEEWENSIIMTYNDGSQIRVSLENIG